MDDEFAVSQAVNYPMVLDVNEEAWIPVMDSCRVPVPGDVNLSKTLEAEDVITVVNFAFKSGCTPLPCEGAADVNCSGAVDAADIIFTVNHIFKGGPAPCDLCPFIEDGTWVCS